MSINLGLKQRTSAQHRIIANDTQHYWFVSQRVLEQGTAH